MDMPEDVRSAIWKHVIRAVKKTVRKHGWDSIADKIDHWTNDPALQDSFLLAVQKGRIRFIDTHPETVEPIKNVISSQDTLFEKPELLGSVFILVTHPGSHNPEVHETLVATLNAAAPNSVAYACWRDASDALLSCIAQELISLPGTSEIRDQYSLQLQHASIKFQQAAIQSLDHIANMTQIQAQQLTAASHLLDNNRSVGLLSGPISTPRRKPYHNVPRPDYKRLVGRDDQLAKLRKLLRSDDRVFQIALTGIGGVGKSALAQAIALELIEGYDSMEEKERFDCIVWASAKEEVLTPYGREPATSTMCVNTLEHIYSRIAAVLETESITVAQPAYQADVVSKVLQNQRCLLIIDNFESVTDPRIKPFLRELPAPTKAIITSRDGFDVADNLRLTGLAPDSAEVLANDEARRHDLELSKDQHRDLLSVTYGIPLAIKLGVARYAAGETFEAIIRWLGDSEGDITDYCVAGQVQLAWKRHSSARSVLLACSLFSMDVGASPEAIRYVADISRHDRDGAITVLLRLQLLQVEQPDRYRMLPIIQRFARTQFVSPDAKDQDLVERWISWHLKIIDQITGSELDTDGYEILDTEYPNVVNAARWCYETNRWPALYTLASGLWGYAYTHSLFIDHAYSTNIVADFGELLSMAMDAGQAMRDDRIIGRVELQRARLQLIQSGPYSNGLIDLLDSAVQKAIVSKDNSDILIALYTKGHVLFRRGELGSAQEIADDLMSQANTTGDNQFAFWAHYRTSEILTARKQFTEALNSLRVAEEHANVLCSMRLRAHVLHRRSAILIAQGNGSDAVPVLIDALELDRARGEIRYVANDMYSLATIYTGMPGMKEEAVRLAQEAHSLYTRLGMTEELRKANDLLSELAVV